MEAFAVSAGVVAIAEIGDKTQLLAIMLAARYRQVWPVIAGIFVATLANHALAALGGTLIARWLTPEVLRIALGVSFLAMAAWALIPDKDEAVDTPAERFGAFAATAVAFFIVEIGDKTQIATAALAARFHAIAAVTAGTTLGMMIANVPAVLLGDRVLRMVPLRVMRIAAAIAFVVLGLIALLWR
ncbi:MAG: UPF0016 domain-containing protein [Alphaproteobacteria bacterium]|nr:UPF0016 domain-containing protein [Alphaproteobacteria bacterium]